MNSHLYPVSVNDIHTELSLYRMRQPNFHQEISKVKQERHFGVNFHSNMMTQNY